MKEIPICAAFQGFHEQPVVSTHWFQLSISPRMTGNLHCVENSEVSSLPCGCARSELCVLFEMVSLKMAPVHGEERILQTNGFLFQHLHGGVQGTVSIKRTLSGYHWQLELPVKACWGENPRDAIPSWGQFLQCQITNQRKHIKINALKNDKLQKNPPWKQRWSIQSCWWGCLQLPGSLSQHSPTVFPQWNMAFLAGGSGCCPFCSGSTAGVWSRLCLTVFVQSQERQISSLAPRVTLLKEHSCMEGALCFPQAVLVVSQTRLWCLSSSSNYGAHGSR